MQSGSLEDQIIKAVGILHGALLTRCLPYHNPAYAIFDIDGHIEYAKQKIDDYAIKHDGFYRR